MKIPEDKINEVRDATDIVEVISQYVSLKRRGKSYFGLCPFHQEKSPSFHVDPIKNFYHCFGCGEGGNVFSFIMKMDKVTFPEAVRNLAQKANITLPVVQEDDSVVQETEALYHVNQMAAEFFRECLLKTVAGKKAADYFSKRGFDPQISEKFLIGYSPNRWDGLILKAKRESIPLENLQKAGLVVPRKDGSGFYDRFRGRLMFPILNTSGRVVGFGGRALTESKDSPKYINSPETAIYRKSKILYGLYQSREGIRKEDKVLFVEGYTDLMRLHQADLSLGVATSGTALTEGQAHLISRYTKNVILVYDGDSAGFAAAIRGADVLLSSGLHVHVAPLPGGMDPDVFLSEKGVDAFQGIIAEAKTIVEFQLSMQQGKQKLQTPADKSQAATEILETIQKIKDPVERQLMIRDLAEKLGIEEALLHQRLKRMKKREGVFTAEPETVTETAVDKAEKILVQMLLEESVWSAPIFSQLKPEDFQNASFRKLIEIIHENHIQGKALDQDALLNQLNSKPDIYQIAVSLITNSSMKAFDLLVQSGLDCILYIKDEKLKKAIRDVKEKMREHQKDVSKVEVLMDQWQDLYKKKNALKQNVTVAWKKVVEKL